MRHARFSLGAVIILGGAVGIAFLTPLLRWMGLDTQALADPRADPMVGLVGVLISVVALVIQVLQSQAQAQAPAADPAPAPAEVASPVRIRELAEPHTLRTALHHALRTDFKPKYTASIYVSRQSAAEAFDRFVQQRERVCWVVTGEAGKGKSNFFCHHAEQLARGEGVYPVLIPAAALDLAETQGGRRGATETLESQILGRVALGRPMARGLAGWARGKKVTGQDFYAWCRVLRKRGNQAVVFIDAINELRGARAQERFNAALDALVARVMNERLPVRFVLSCRTEVWPSFSQPQEPAWIARHLHAPILPLPGLDGEQAEAALARYQAHFKVKLVLSGEARQTSYDPLMLRLLFSAAEASGKPVMTVTSLRRKAVLDVYAMYMRESMTARVRDAFLASGVGPDDPRDIEQTLTRYLIGMAGQMLHEGRPYITPGEVLQVAHRLHIPDGRFAGDPRRLASAPDSVFRHFLSEGILVEREQGAHQYGFVFETYFEYSLGRFLALEEWLPRREQPTAVQAHLQALLARHRVLVQEKNFGNLAGAIPLALFTVDADPRFDAHRGVLLPLLLETLIAAEGFHSTRLALASLQEMRLADASTWRSIADASAEGQAAIRLFKRFLHILDSATQRPDTDFVVMWDTSAALEKLAGARPGLVLEHVKRWATEGRGLQPFFSLNALSRVARADLASGELRALVEQMSALTQEPRITSNFWLVHALVSTALELTAKTRHGGTALEPALHAALWSAVEQIARTGAETARAYALAALPLLSQGYADRMQRVLDLLAGEENRWAWWNTAYELHAWPEAWKDEIELPLRLLRRAAEHPSPDVRYAAARATQRNALYRQHDPACVEQIQRSLAGTRWGLRLSPGPVRPTHQHLTGVMYHPAFLEPAYDHHIECRERIQVVLSRLEELCEGCFNWIVPRRAEQDEIRCVHGRSGAGEVFDRHSDGSAWPTYLEDLHRITGELEEGGPGRATQVDNSLELRAESLEVAELSAGAVLQGIDYVLRGPAPAAWALNRPPGHLANNKICIFNNVAIGAHYARSQYGLRRLLIVDCDAHHGKHTDHVFAADPDVLYFSIHVDQDYTREDGTLHHTGRGPGEGYTFNLPHPPYMGDADYVYLIDNLLVPLAEEFRPELVLLSAGFDGLAADHLTPQCMLTERSYIHLARQLRRIARRLNIKLVASFEGGYALEGNARSFIHMMNTFGEWGIADSAIGFSERTLPHWRVDDTHDRVHELVRQRVVLMDETRRRDPGYAFDTRRAPWQQFLASGQHAAA